MQVNRSRASEDFLPPDGVAKGHCLLANDSDDSVRARHTAFAAPLARPAPATRPEASQPSPTAPLPSSGPFPDPCRTPYSRTFTSLPPRHRSARICTLMPCRAARSRAQELWRLWRRVATAGDDLSGGRRRLGQRRWLQAAPQWPPDPPELLDEPNCRYCRLPAWQRDRTRAGGGHAVSHVSFSRLVVVVAGCVSPHRCVCR